MFEMNSNLIVIVFGLISGIGSYWSARKANRPIKPSFIEAMKNTLIHVCLGILYFLALNTLRLSWNSLAGIGLGLVIGFAGAICLLAFSAVRDQRRRRHFR